MLTPIPQVEGQSPHSSRSLQLASRRLSQVEFIIKLTHLNLEVTSHLSLERDCFVVDSVFD
jgi:hypothetical protein